MLPYRRSILGGSCISIPFSALPVILRADGIHAFVPKPFDASDVLRVIWAVSGFDSRKRSPSGAE